MCGLLHVAHFFGLRAAVKEDPKRVYYLSLEFLMGRSLLNALMNLDLDKPYAEALSELGYKLEVQMPSLHRSSRTVATALVCCVVQCP
jgi:glucan phosphorylase